MWKSIVAVLLFASLLSAADLSEKFAKKLNIVEDTYKSAVQKADNTRFYAVQKANQDRVKVLKAALVEATKAGDFDAATEIKARITSAESAVRTKPSNTVKFGRHEYALINDKVTWYIAKTQCEQMAGHLVIIDTPEEQAFVDRLIEDNRLVWLGASDHEKDDAYVWVNGKAVDTSKMVLDREMDGISDVLVYDKKFSNIADWFSGARLAYVCEWDN